MPKNQKSSKRSVSTSAGSAPSSLVILDRDAQTKIERIKKLPIEICIRSSSFLNAFNDKPEPLIKIVELNLTDKICDSGTLSFKEKLVLAMFIINHFEEDARVLNQIARLRLQAWNNLISYFYSCYLEDAPCATNIKEYETLCAIFNNLHNRIIQLLNTFFRPTFMGQRAKIGFILKGQWITKDSFSFEEISLYKQKAWEFYAAFIKCKIRMIEIAFETSHKVSKADLDIVESSLEEIRVANWMTRPKAWAKKFNNLKGKFESLRQREEMSPFLHPGGIAGYLEQVIEDGERELEKANSEPHSSIECSSSNIEPDDNTQKTPEPVLIMPIPIRVQAQHVLNTEPPKPKLIKLKDLTKSKRKPPKPFEFPNNDILLATNTERNHKKALRKKARQAELMRQAAEQRICLVGKDEHQDEIRKIAEDHAPQAEEAERNVQWFPPESTLYEKFNLDPNLVNILKSISSMGYIAVLGGSYVRNKLYHRLYPNISEISSETIDVYTNCPPGELSEITFDSIRINSINAHSLPEIAQRLDYTVNTFFIDENGNAHDCLDAMLDLINKKIVPMNHPVNILSILSISRQLSWPLSSEAALGIRYSAVGLSTGLSFADYLAFFEKTFCSTSNYATVENISLFANLGIVSYLFSSDPNDCALYDPSRMAIIFPFWQGELARYQSDDPVYAYNIMSLLALPFVVFNPNINNIPFSILVRDFILKFTGKFSDSDEFNSFFLFLENSFSLMYTRFNQYNTNRLEAQVVYLEQELSRLHLFMAPAPLVYMYNPAPSISAEQLEERINPDAVAAKTSCNM